MSKKYDVAVIGTGPGGSACAYFLAQAGLSVAIFDKLPLPRYKPCGGGLSPQVQEWFDFDLAPAVSLAAPKLRCTFGGENPVEGEVRGTGIWMVRREHFDFFLAQKAVEKGAVLRDSCPVEGGTFDGANWALSAGGDSVLARFVVAADGAKGVSARWLGLPIRKNNIAGALEGEATLAYEQDGVVHLEFGLIPGGYLWNFPKADGHSIGGGGFKGSVPKNLREITERYSEQFGVDFSACTQHGHPLNLWCGKQRLHGKNCLAVGEAACVVDPFTAEGIRPSILSARIAAKALVGAAAGDSGALARYSSELHEEHGVDMMWAQRLATVFYMAPKLAYEHGVKRAGAFEWMTSLMTGERRYRDAARSAIAKFRRVPAFGSLRSR